MKKFLTKKIVIIVIVVILFFSTVGGLVLASEVNGWTDWTGDGELAEAQAIVTQLVFDINTLEEERAELVVERDNLLLDTTADQNTIDSLNSQIGTLTESLNSLGTQLQDTTNERDWLQDELDAANLAARNFKDTVCAEVIQLPNGIYNGNSNYSTICPK